MAQTTVNTVNPLSVGLQHPARQEPTEQTTERPEDAPHLCDEVQVCQSHNEAPEFDSMKNLSVTERMRCCGDVGQSKSSGTELRSASLQHRMRKRGSEVDILWLTLCAQSNLEHTLTHSHADTLTEGLQTISSPLPGLFFQKLLPSVAYQLHVSKFLLLFSIFVCLFPRLSPFADLCTVCRVVRHLSARESSALKRLCSARPPLCQALCPLCLWESEETFPLDVHWAELDSYPELHLCKWKKHNGCSHCLSRGAVAVRNVPLSKP